MSAVTKPIMLDETGRDIHTILCGINGYLQTVTIHLSNIKTSIDNISTPVKSKQVSATADEDAIVSVPLTDGVPVSISNVTIGTTQAEAAYQFIAGLDGDLSVKLTDREGSAAAFAEATVSFTLYYINT